MKKNFIEGEKKCRVQKRGGPLVLNAKEQTKNRTERKHKRLRLPILTEPSNPFETCDTPLK